MGTENAPLILGIKKRLSNTLKIKSQVPYRSMIPLIVRPHLYPSRRAEKKLSSV